jgi:hypothetical protein
MISSKSEGAIPPKKEPRSPTMVQVQQFFLLFASYSEATSLAWRCGSSAVAFSFV